MSATHRSAVSYIDKSRTYYAAQGYTEPYRWASNADAPFTPLRGPLCEQRVGVATTAFPIDVELPKQVLARPADPPPVAMFTADLSWDKEATHTDDVGTFLPLWQLADLARTGVIGSVGPRFYCVPTEYSQRRTATDAAQVAAWVAEDELDLLLLVPL